MSITNNRTFEMNFISPPPNQVVVFYDECVLSVTDVYIKRKTIIATTSIASEQDLKPNHC
jgi:hypothetical protein